MRILYVNDLYYGGGAEEIFRSLAECFERRGHQVFTATAARTDIANHRRIDCVSGDIPSLLLRRSIWVNNDLLAYRSLEKIINEVKPDMVHCHNLYHVSLAPLIIAQQNNIPCVLTVHDYWPICTKRSLLGPDGKICKRADWNKCAFHCVHRKAGILANPFLRRALNKRLKILSPRKKFSLVCVSKYVRETISGFGINKEKVKVVYNGVDIEKFAPTEKSGREMTVIYVGATVEAKGFHQFINIAQRVKLKIPDARFVAVGGRKDADAGNVENRGRVPLEELIQLYQNATCICIPRLWPEPFPTVILEAMACGTPVVAYATGGIAEMVEHGKTGLLAKRGSIDKLAHYVTALLKNMPLVHSLGTDARKQAVQIFSRDRMIESYDKIYSGLLS